MEAAGGHDAASDVSYESAASEGGFAPASERGRDSLPRLISSSNCIGVFQWLCWDETYSCRTYSKEEKDRLAKAKGLRPPFNPTSSLPKRGIMRFDGAMEAWLEELPLPKDIAAPAAQYESLNDAATRISDRDILQYGNGMATIWYFGVEFLQKLWPFCIDQPADIGPRNWEALLVQRGQNITTTHVELGKVHFDQKTEGRDRLKWLKSLFSALQTSAWSRNGEACTLLVSRRLSHAAMSVGDAVQIGRDLYFVTLTGFIRVHEAAVLLQGLVAPEKELAKYGLSEACTEELEPIAKDSKKKEKGKGKGKGKSEVDKENGKVHQENQDDTANGDAKPDQGKSKKSRKKKKASEPAPEDDYDYEWEPPSNGKNGKGGKGSKGGKGNKGGSEKGKGKDKGKGSGKGKGKGKGGDDREKGGRAALRKQFQAEREKVQSSY